MVATHMEATCSLEDKTNLNTKRKRILEFIQCLKLCRLNANCKSPNPFFCISNSMNHLKKNNRLPTSNHIIKWSMWSIYPLYIHISSSCSQHFSISTVEICSISAVMGSWVRTITTPFRKACTCTPINPPRDQKKHQPGFNQFTLLV